MNQKKTSIYNTIDCPLNCDHTFFQSKYSKGQKLYIEIANGQYHVHYKGLFPFYLDTITKEEFENIFDIQNATFGTVTYKRAK